MPADLAPTTVVMSIVAEDRPGLVQVLAELVAAHNGNWIDSSMARLGGEFAGIVRIEIPAAVIPDLEEALAGLADQGITVTAKRSDIDSASTGVAATGINARLELTVGDHPGIVRDISTVLNRHGVSIYEFETRVFTGSMSGEHLFSATARIVLPNELSVDHLRQALEDIAQDIMVEIDLKEAA